jgi:hypothetical protein
MKSQINQLRESLDRSHELLAKAERAGMEVSRPLYDLAEGRDHLVRARVEIHRFDPAQVRKLVDAGRSIAAAAEQSGQKALEELAYRRKGLAVSVVILLGMIVLLLLKIRQLGS